MATSRGCRGGSEILVELKRAKRRRLCVRPTDRLRMSVSFSIRVWARGAGG